MVRANPAFLHLRRPCCSTAALGAPAWTRGVSPLSSIPGLEVLPAPDADSLSVWSTEQLLIVLAGHIDTCAELLAQIGGPNSACSAVGLAPRLPRADPGPAVRAPGSDVPPGSLPRSAEAPFALPGAAALVAHIWEARRERAVDGLRGAFALVVWDRARPEVLAFRDHVGQYPLFWACGERGAVLISPSIDLLLQQPGVGRDVNRAALADHLSHRWPDKEETCFLSVKRIPPGNVLRLSERDRRLERYWSPGMRGDTIDWISDEEIVRFDPLFEQAVRRSAMGAPTGISLSGGLDSISVASVLASLAAASGASRPLALSLGFPGECSEEGVQRSVATGLGLDQIFVPILDSVGDRGIVGSSLDLAASRPLPLLSPWCSSYFNLAGLARQHGVDVILTGTGGDEWLTVSPYYAADLMLRADIGGILRMASANHRSFNVSWARVLRGLGRFGVRPIASMALGRVAPVAWRRSRLARLMRKTPSWVAPDPALRRELAERAELALTDPGPPEGFYAAELRASLDHPLVAWEVEESFETGRSAGVLYRHPYLDADLIDFLFRVPPQILNRGGRSKGLVREAVSRRFPALGFERQKKATGTSFYRSLLQREGPVEWKRLAGPRKMGEIGLVDLDSATATAEKIFQGFLPELHRIWDILALETWLRARC
ncbi:MAG: asparagine synthase-related protein [Vicinamibacterales bacterium]